MGSSEIPLDLTNFLKNFEKLEELNMNQSNLNKRSSPMPSGNLFDNSEAIPNKIFKPDENLNNLKCEKNTSQKISSADNSKLMFYLLNDLINKANGSVLSPPKFDVNLTTTLPLIDDLRKIIEHNNISNSSNNSNNNNNNNTMLLTYSLLSNFQKQISNRNFIFNQNNNLIDHKNNIMNNLISSNLFNNNNTSNNNTTNNENGIPSTQQNPLFCILSQFISLINQNNQTQNTTNISSNGSTTRILQILNIWNFLSPWITFLNSAVKLAGQLPISVNLTGLTSLNDQNNIEEIYASIKSNLTTLENLIIKYFIQLSVLLSKISFPVIQQNSTRQFTCNSASTGDQSYHAMEPEIPQNSTMNQTCDSDESPNQNVISSNESLLMKLPMSNTPFSQFTSSSILPSNPGSCSTLAGISDASFSNVNKPNDELENDVAIAADQDEAKDHSRIFIDLSATASDVMESPESLNTKNDDLAGSKTVFSAKSSAGRNKWSSVSTPKSTVGRNSKANNHRDGIVDDASKSFSSQHLEQPHREQRNVFSNDLAAPPTEQPDQSPQSSSLHNSEDRSLNDLAIYVHGVDMNANANANSNPDKHAEVVSASDAANPDDLAEYNGRLLHCKMGLRERFNPGNLSGGGSSSHDQYALHHADTAANSNSNNNNNSNSNKTNFVQLKKSNFRGTSQLENEIDHSFKPTEFNEEVVLCDEFPLVRVTKHVYSVLTMKAPKSATRLIRLLMKHFFSQDTLAKSSLSGEGIYKDRLQPEIIESIKIFIKRRHPHLKSGSINLCMTDVCVQARRVSKNQITRRTGLAGCSAGHVGSPDEQEVDAAMDDHSLLASVSARTPPITTTNTTNTSSSSALHTRIALSSGRVGGTVRKSAANKQQKRTTTRPYTRKCSAAEMQPASKSSEEQPSWCARSAGNVRGVVSDVSMIDGGV